MQYHAMGYDSYEQYLSGPDWREIKNIFYAAAPWYRCRLCHNTSGLLVHHRSYAHLDAGFFRSRQGRELLEKILVYLCPRCNRLVHHYADGSRVPLDYLFLMHREEEVYWMPIMVWRRLYRDASDLFFAVAEWTGDRWRRRSAV